ncbi:LYAR-type C2HC zinc finger protein [Cardiosporidium cionae]|uniref:LYAR-type C2HC zinc finger protein n=1 Tax=Cardiosporidium cionae TaxID=476202 RepID=A0ABQ7J821_9APIC|nr:LYAR-type C2HC zinc finger protein [Cardiosporidium cionae]|eukprot:KAF8819835.1 LYAR-type C2HC zinc finger protein [Cardiosporidium cionae]
MVSFTCDICQDVLKKRAIESHCLHGQCRNAWNFTCIDCNCVFEGYAYVEHTSCISEEDKYKGPYSRSKRAKSEKSSATSVSILKDSVVDKNTQCAKMEINNKEMQDAYIANSGTGDNSWDDCWLNLIDEALRAQGNHSLRYSKLSRVVVSAYLSSNPSCKISKEILLNRCLACIPDDYLSITDSFVRLPLHQKTYASNS